MTPRQSEHFVLQAKPGLIFFSPMVLMGYSASVVFLILHINESKCIPVMGEVQLPTRGHLASPAWYLASIFINSHLEMNRLVLAVQARVV